jgi:hypothetical protein
MGTIKCTSTSWKSFMMLTYNNFMALLLLLTILATNNNNTNALITIVGITTPPPLALFQFFLLLLLLLCLLAKFNWILLGLYCVPILFLCFSYFRVAEELFFKKLINAPSRNHVHVRFGSLRF